MSLLSVPDLVRRINGVIFIPGTSVLIELDGNYEVLGQGKQDKDGLFYIADDQSRNGASTSKNDSCTIAMAQ